MRTLMTGVKEQTRLVEPSPTPMPATLFTPAWLATLGAAQRAQRLRECMRAAARRTAGRYGSADIEVVTESEHAVLAGVHEMHILVLRHRAS